MNGRVTKPMARPAAEHWSTAARSRSPGPGLEAVGTIFGSHDSLRPAQTQGRYLRYTLSANFTEPILKNYTLDRSALAELAADTKAYMHTSNQLCQFNGSQIAVLQWPQKQQDLTSPEGFGSMTYFSPL